MSLNGSFFFLRRSAKKTIDVPSIFPCFFGFSCEIVPSTNPVVIRHEKSSSFQINRRPGICWRNAVGSHRTLFFCFDQWAVAEKNGCGSCREAVACCHFGKQHGRAGKFTCLIITTKYDWLGEHFTKFLWMWMGFINLDLWSAHRNGYVNHVFNPYVYSGWWFGTFFFIYILGMS